MGSIISGVVVEPLEQFRDERGRVMRMMRSTSPLFQTFGEIYFSVVKSGVVKAWKYHRAMTQHFAVPVGSIRLVLWDDRSDSPTRGVTQVLDLGEEDYALVKIPPRLWYGFQGTSVQPALIANCTDMPHDPKEQETAPLTDPRFPHQWEKIR